jgi:DNA helicase II / ATP-dependent DNA helicase PcrA
VLSNNNVLMSAAGSGKTTHLVEQALAHPSARIAILTYTVKNLAELHASFVRKAGHVPANVTLLSWYEFLLQECIRPYQRFIYPNRRIEGLHFVSGQTVNYAKRSDVARYYVTPGSLIYSDRACAFVLDCNTATNGAVLDRLCARFTDIYIDEVQDLAGHDWDFVALLMERSGIAITLVGDTRQGTYATHHSAKNKQFKSHRASELFAKWAAMGLCVVLHRNESYRCPPSICALADSLYPSMPATLSKNNAITGHDGVFVVARRDIDAYVAEFSPTLLRYDRKTDSEGRLAQNFGAVKGLTFARVLILSNGVVKAFLKSGDPSTVTSPAKYYVAFTRARHSLAFVHDGPCALANAVPYVPRTD